MRFFTTSTILAFAALGCYAAVSVRAQGVATTAEAAADLTTLNHVLKSTLFDEGNVNGALPKGGTYVFGNVTPFACPDVCTLEVEAMVQMRGSRAAANVWAICPFVDKSNAAFDCAIQGTLPTGNDFVVGNFAWSVPLAKGIHTAQPGVTVTAPAGIFDYHITYHLYQP